MKRTYVAAPSPMQARARRRARAGSVRAPRLVWLTGAGARGDEQRREDGEGDEVAEREVDDPGQPVDERVADGEEAVDAAGGEPGDDHLDDEAHGGTLLR